MDELRACRVGPAVLLAGAGTGPLAGTTFLAKDVLDVAGHATGAGNPTWLTLAAPATQSAAVVDELMRAGATCIGKSHTDEFAYSLAGRNPYYGTPHNTAAPGCTPGGSSSGSAAAVAGGLVPFALGTDTGGSIRVPASYCGIVGVRPTHGAVSTAGVVPLAPTFDTLGWLASTAEMALRVGDVLLPADSGPTPQRLALLSDAQAAAPPEVRDAVEGAGEMLSRRTGLPLTTVALPGADLDIWLVTFRTLQTAEAHAAHGAWVAAHPGAVSPDVKERFDSGAAVTPEAARAGAALRTKLRTALLQDLAAPSTVLLLPSAPGTATPLAAKGARLAEVRTATLRLTCVAGIAGLPAVSVPLAAIAGLPLGVCLVGAPGTDRSLLNLCVG